MAARRFYKEVAVRPAAAGFAVTLDGKAIKTPARHDLVVPSRALAERLAAEWDAQDGDIRPETMPLNRFANTALDRVGEARGTIAEGVAAYARSDLLCHLAPNPESLSEQQRAAWQPWLDWAEKRYGAGLIMSMGLMPVDQPQEALEALAAAVRAADDWRLTALSECVALTGSLILGLALMEEALSATEAWSLSQMDEDYQAEHWGLDAEAEVARNARRQALLDAVDFLSLCPRGD